MTKPSSTTSSSSSVASTSASYEGATASCLAGMLRRIFRLNSPPVGYANAKLKEFSSKEEEFDAKAASPGPGIVPRLMGLETLPQTMKIPGEGSPVSVLRSRSMSDPDYREKCEVDGDPRSRVKPTSSFCETPTYLEIENEEFLVLIFENRTDHGHRTGIRKRKRKKGRNRTSILVKNESCPPSENYVVERNPKSVEMSGLAKLRNVMSGPQEVVLAAKRGEVECSPENSSSPVSVLEFGEFITDDLKTSTSDEWTMENSDDPKKRCDGNLLHDQSMRPNLGPRRKGIPRQRGHHGMQMPLSSWEIMPCNGGTGKYGGASVDICADIGGQISDEMIDDLVVQLSCASRKSRNPQEQNPSSSKV